MSKVRSVNESQVGGNHYLADLQHWDFVNTVLQGRYLEGCASKYITRWRKKNGTQDLLKAKHYIQKIRDLVSMETGSVEEQPTLHALYLKWTRNAYVPLDRVHAVKSLNPLPDIEHFCQCNHLSPVETQAIITLSTWSTLSDLDRVLARVDALICEAETQIVRLRLR